jgi:membrane protein YqaA with SNARE-associated domain
MIATHLLGLLVGFFLGAYFENRLQQRVKTEKKKQAARAVNLARQKLADIASQVKFPTDK